MAIIYTDTGTAVQLTCTAEEMGWIRAAVGVYGQPGFLARLSNAFLQMEAAALTYSNQEYVAKLATLSPADQEEVKEVIDTKAGATPTPKG